MSQHPAREFTTMDELLSGLETFSEHTASLALHERVGFPVTGTRQRIGQLNGIWRDTLFLERRSTLVG